jgi:Universal stress protein family
MILLPGKRRRRLRDAVATARATYREYSGARAADPLKARRREAAARRDEPDVRFDVLSLMVDEVTREVDNLQARVALQARVVDMLGLDVGGDIGRDPAAQRQTVGREQVVVECEDVRASATEQRSHLHAFVGDADAHQSSFGADRRLLADGNGLDENHQRLRSAWRVGPASASGPPADLAPLVVGFDGSMPAIAALAWAAGTGIPIIVVRVLEPRPRARRADRAEPAVDINDARRVLGDHVGIVARSLADCAWRAEVVEACCPATGLAASARRYGAIGIVVGARGDSRGQAVLGGQLYQLLTTADVPVVVLPLQAAARLLCSPVPPEERVPASPTMTTL